MNNDNPTPASDPSTFTPMTDTHAARIIADSPWERMMKLSQAQLTYPPDEE